MSITLTRRFSKHGSRLLSRSHTFAIIVILDLKIHQNMWIHWPFFPKTWTKGHWPLDDLWPHVCWGHMCDSTQGSLCASPMTIHQCMWIQWSILQIPHTYTYYVHTTYYVQNERSHSLLLNSVQARQKPSLLLINGVYQNDWGLQNTAFVEKNESSTVCQSFSEKPRRKLSQNRKKYNNSWTAKDHGQRGSLKCP